MSVTCVFCGGPLDVRTREHVLPQWLAAELGLSNGVILPTHFSDTGEVLSDRRHTIDQFVCGRVCGNCNHGWMSGLETTNQELLKKLIHGELDTLDLSDDEAENLALWAAKTAFALHAASNFRRIVPDTHYRLITEKHAVPPLVWVVGKRWHSCSGFSWAQSTSWAILQHDRQISVSEQARIKSEAYKICMQIGQLLLLIAHNPLPSTRCLLWQFLHVPLHPRRGPVSWLRREPESPTDYPVKACFAFHLSFGLVLTNDGPPGGAG
jgi:hypothetical protein